MKAFLTPLALAAVLAGCATSPSPNSGSFTYEDYHGPQNAWEVHPGAFSRTVAGVELFALDQLPSRAYRVLGKATVLTVSGRDDETKAQEALVRLCKAHHADAALLRSQAVINAYENAGLRREYWLVRYTRP